jgi:hypothetical protein
LISGYWEETTMTRLILRHLALGTALFAIATSSAAAQGRGNGRGNKAPAAKPAKANKAKPQATTRVSTGDVVISGVRKVPPGLAKKPGQMPPGQYKKLYTAREGAVQLRDVFGRNGYVVTRIVPAGSSEYVYYQRPDGSIVRAIVSPGTDRLRFTNVPALILNQLLARLY